MRLRPFILSLMICLGLMWSRGNDSIAISLVNFYPGANIYELEGHTAIRIRTGHEDVMINYGSFDFNAPNFVYRFVKGETDYRCEPVPSALFVRAYQMEGRRVVEHPILLDSVQKVTLISLVRENLRPENSTYRYNYVKDNCATRPLGVIEKAIGDSIVLGQSSTFPDNDNTFRSVMRHYHRNYPWYQFGIDLALGSGIDYPISNRELSFAPVVLDEQLTSAKAVDADGAERPLFGAPIVLNEGHDATLGPTPWLLTPMAVALAIFILGAVLTWRDIKRLRITKWFDATLYGIFGLLGCLLTFLIFVSVHEATSPNYLFLWLNPLALIVPIFIWLKKYNIAVISYQFVNFALLLALIIAWPWCGQSANAAFVPLIACDLMRSFTYIYVSIKQKKDKTTHSKSRS